MKFLRITGRDPLVARDGRPFGAGQGNRMRSAGWLLPSVVAGSFRTTLGKEAGRPFDDRTQQDLLAIAVAGVLPVADGQLFLPAPCDCVLSEKLVYRARPEPLAKGEGGDWPMPQLQPVLIDAPDDFKPDAGPAFWPLDAYAKWLMGNSIDPRNKDFLDKPEADLRDHVSLDAERGAAAEGMLFTTAGIGSSALRRFDSKLLDAKPTGDSRRKNFAEIDLVARVGDVPEWAEQPLAHLSTWHPLGGERRLAHWRTSDDAHLWRCPEDLIAKLGKTNKITMTLATPAIFRDGWKPGWLDDALTGTLPFPGMPKLTLVGVCIKRWQAVSGWSYKDGGPKAIRRMVPAGGVYFFESQSNDNSKFGDVWLLPVSDDVKDNRDGFGLAIWGTW